eukprot:2291472-Pleurochrysis_carterae.AAC.1
MATWGVGRVKGAIPVKYRLQETKRLGECGVAFRSAEATRVPVLTLAIGAVLGVTVSKVEIGECARRFGDAPAHLDQRQHEGAEGRGQRGRPGVGRRDVKFGGQIEPDDGGARRGGQQREQVHLCHDMHAPRGEWAVTQTVACECSAYAC